MAVPVLLNSNNKKKFLSLNTFVVAISLVAILLCLIITFGPTMYYLDDQHQRHHQATMMLMNMNLNIKNDTTITTATRASNNQNGQQLPLLEVKNLRHEAMFQDMIKSCIPSSAHKKKCMVHIPELPSSQAGEKPHKRIAIISPPSGDMATPILEQAERIVANHNNKMNNKKPTSQSNNIDLILRNNVPPYGYGKTHGLSEIIRVVPNPLLVEVTSALQGALSGQGESYTDITLEDLKAALRLVLRFHCRLSHVAAHTALLSINSTATTATTAKELTSFLLSSSEDGGGGGGDGNSGNNDQVDLYGTQEKSKYGTQILSHVQSSLSTDDGNKNNLLYDILDQVLLDEMSATRNFTKWPCPSFWSVNSGSSGTRSTTMSPIIQRIASEMSPKCDKKDDPFASCFVERDKCESRGNALCEKKK